MNKEFETRMFNLNDCNQSIDDIAIEYRKFKT